MEVEIEMFCPASRQDWRQWLKENHSSKQSVWLVYYKKKSNVPSISWSEAVDEALCFGWIDSKAMPLDEDKYRQFFSKRKPNSVWSKINKGKVEALIKEGLIERAGFESIEIAKKNGSWNILDEVEELILPQDLEKAFEANPNSKDYFLGLSKSIKKAILQWIAMAKQEETRERRINQTAELAGMKQKPKQF